MKLKKISLIVGIVFLIPFLVALGLFINYQFDDDLHPEVANIINTTQKPIPLEQNAFIALLGLFGEENEDMYEKGLSIYRTAEQIQRRDGSDMMLFANDIEDAILIKLKLEQELDCIGEPSRSCLDEFGKNKAQYKELIKQNSLLVKRIRSVYAYPFYQEPISISAYANLIGTHKMSLADIGLEWLSGNKDLALTLLRDDMNFWRKVAAGEISLITRMVAIAIINHDLQLISEIVQDCGDCRKFEGKFEEILKPFTVDEMTIRNAMYNEFRYVHRALAGLLNDDTESPVMERGLKKLIIKKNSVLNKIYSRHEKAINLSECEIDKIKFCYELYFDTKHDDGRMMTWEFIDDPIGSTLANITDGAFERYVWSGHRLELYRRLIEIQYLFKIQNIKREDYENYMTSLPARFLNPFTAKPPVYNDKHQQLQMKPPESVDSDTIIINI